MHFMKAEELFWSGLEEQIAEEAAAFPGVASAAVLDLEGGLKLEVNESLQLAAGSTIKVPVLMELFRKEAEGVLDLEGPCTVTERQKVAGSGVLQHLEGDVTLTLRNMAILMINVSDNIATNICIERANMTDVNELIDDIGCKSTSLRRMMIDWQAAVEGRENVTTAADMVRWLEVLYRGELVDVATSKQVLAILRKPKKSPIRAGLPVELSLAGKTGGLEGVRCEVGLIEQARRPYILAVMSAFALEDNNDAFITAVSHTVHAHMERLDRFTRYGRGLPVECYDDLEDG
jgi:beta-lactamase class A